MLLSAEMTKMNIFACPQSDTWARFWEIMRSSGGGMGERLTCRVAFKVDFSLFLAFDFCGSHNGKC